jgi:hypothetical protein
VAANSGLRGSRATGRSCTAAGAAACRSRLVPHVVEEVDADGLVGQRDADLVD